MFYEIYVTGKNLPLTAGDEKRTSDDMTMALTFDTFNDVNVDFQCKWNWRTSNINDLENSRFLVLVLFNRSI